MTRLLIVESPNKTDKIQHYLGSGWVVAASYGHIRDLPPGEMGVAPPDYRPQYVTGERSGKTIAKLKALARDQPFVDEECGEFFLHITCHQCHMLPLLFLLRLPNDRLDRWVDRLLVKHCTVWLINRIRELLDCLYLGATLRHLQEWDTTRHKKRHHY